MAYLQFVQQQQAARDLLLSNQVSKGFEQLASQSSFMRLGGICALEGVMNGSDQYHRPVLKALCAFVRDKTIGMITSGAPATDIQAAVTVIGSRVVRPEAPETIDLARVNLPKVNLFLANLSGARCPVPTYPALGLPSPT